MCDLPPSVLGVAQTLVAQLADFDRQLVEIDRACGRYSAQLRFLEVEPAIAQTLSGLERIRRKATELGEHTVRALDALGPSPDVARWQPHPGDLIRRY